MPVLWWTVPALIVGLALAILVIGVAALGRRRHVRAFGSIVSSGMLVAIAAIALLLGLDLQTYRRLSFERPVATVDIRQTGGLSFDVTLAEPPRSGRPAPTPRSYAVQGDEWRVEARVLKWKPWAGLLGLDARYRLDRLSGEFSNTEAEINGPRSVYDLQPARRSDAIMASLADRLNQTGLVDTLYGSAVLMPMADGARYELSVTQSGLVARPANDAATRALSAWH